MKHIHFAHKKNVNNSGNSRMIRLLLVEAVEAAPLLDAFAVQCSVIPSSLECWIWNVIFSSMQQRRLASSMLRDLSERRQ